MCFVCLPVWGTKQLLCVSHVYVCVSEHMRLCRCDSVSAGLIRCWGGGAGAAVNTAESVQTEHISEPLNTALLSALHVCTVLVCVPAEC